MTLKMNFSLTRDCLNCGMTTGAPQLILADLPASLVCPKCDENMLAQADGAILCEDIAHQRETLQQALSKLEALVIEAWQGTFSKIRVIVGTGVIREEVAGLLHYYQQQHYILDYREEGKNRGAFLVTIRK